jgi:hypothetical protein
MAVFMKEVIMKRKEVPNLDEWRFKSSSPIKPASPILESGGFSEAITYEETAWAYAHLGSGKRPLQLGDSFEPQDLSLRDEPFENQVSLYAQNSETRAPQIQSGPKVSEALPP